MKRIFFTILCLFYLSFLIAQTQGVSINSTGTAPHSSAILDVHSPDKGVLIPRMTSAQREAITNPAPSLLVYQTDHPEGIYEYINHEWCPLGTVLRTGFLQGNLTQFLNIVPDVSQPISQGGGAPLINGRWQSITVEQTGLLAEVEIQSLYSMSGPTIRVYEGEGTGGNLLIEEVFSPKPAGWNKFSFLNPLMLEEGEQFTLYIEDQNGSWVAGHFNPYAGGISSVNVEYDFTFKTYMAIKRFDLLRYDSTNGVVNLANDLLTLTFDGKVGIATTTPQNRLDVEGGLAIGADYAGSQIAPTNGAIIQGDVEIGSNVGIGITNPFNKLDVNGGLAIGTGYAGSQMAPTNGAIIEGRLGVGIDSPDNMLDVGGAVSIGAGYAGNFTAPQNGAIIKGNVGIGTVSPVNLLDVNGSLAIGVGYAGSEIAPTNGAIIQGDVEIGSNVGIGTTNPLNKLDVNGGVAIGANYAGIQPAPNNGAIIEGKVGIGTESPINKLDVEGGLAVGVDFSGTYTVPYNGAIIQGNVGIGTESPFNKLDVEGGLAIGADYAGSQVAPTNGAIIQGDVEIGSKVGIGTTNPVNKLDIEGGLAVGVAFSGAQTAPDNGAIIQGNVGIGTANPTKAKLEISGHDLYDPGFIGYLNGFGNIGYYNPAGDWSYSIYATNSISGAEFHAHSDQRIKNIQGLSDNAADLETLLQIEVTDYRMRDTLQHGSDITKKVIAQQVAEVYPQAVSTGLTEVVPDIYQRANVEDGWILLATDLQVGERVKIITETSSEVHKVTAAEKDRFKVADLSSVVSPVFVYGREVDDFHTVDYEAIAMLNVSATQAQQVRIETLEDENEILKQRLAQIERLLLSQSTTTSIGESSE